jgi:hypothetical protein
MTWLASCLTLPPACLPALPVQVRVQNDTTARPGDFQVAGVGEATAGGWQPTCLPARLPAFVAVADSITQLPLNRHRQLSLDWLTLPLASHG